MTFGGSETTGAAVSDARHNRSVPCKVKVKVKYLSSHFQLNNPADGAESVDGPDQSRIAVQGLKHARRPCKHDNVNGSDLCSHSFCDS